MAMPQASQAASGSNLAVAWTTPGTVLASATARYEVRVANTGNRNSSATTTVQVTLPITANSPSPRVMGTVSNLTTGCSVVQLKITCAIGSIPRFGGVGTIAFDMALPVKAGALNFAATVSAANNLNAANNSSSFTASQSYHTVSDAAPADLTVTSCSGSSSLTSFFECVSGSTMQHQVRMAPGGVLDFSITPADYTGSWAVAGTQLTMTYLSPEGDAVTFVGQGASANCWEGPMIFSSTSRAIYRVCRP